jgi:capsid protein
LVTPTKLDEAIRKIRNLAENVDYSALLGITDPRDLQAELDGFGFYPAMIPPYYRQSQSRGEVLPVYTTELQLRLIRDRCRKLAVENEFAICALENRQSYVVGKGFQYKAVAHKKAQVEPELLERVQNVIDMFVEANELADVEQDMMRRMDVDGEVFVRVFPQESGLLLTRFIEAEHVRSPDGDTHNPHNSFGIQTDEDDVEAVQGYWVIERAWENQQPKLIPAGHVLHLKLNVPRSSKRGLPTFYPVEQNLRRAEDLLGSMATMAKTRAKIALIRRFNGMTRATAENLVSALTDATVTDPATGAEMNLERMRFGTILNASDNIDYEMPGANVDVGAFVSCLQAELRAVASRLNMPEWMLTADASNANYSSSLVAEAPSTKCFERLQTLLKRKIGESRYEAHESLIWKQLRHAVKIGILPDTIYKQIDVQVEGPSLAARNKGEEASLNAQYLQLQIKSPQTICAELGLDYEKEMANLAAHKQEAQRLGIAPPEPPAGPGAGDPGAPPGPATEAPPEDPSGLPAPGSDPAGGVDPATLE